MIDFRKLVKAGVHFGHEASRWCPSMSPYIWGMKNNIHLIDVSKTAYQLEKASQFLEKIAAEGKQILFVGTKKSAQSIVQDAATKLNMPYVNHRWVGGTLSNYSQVKKSITRLLHFEDIVAKAEQFPHYTKKEINVFQKNIERLEKSVGGIRNLAWPLGALVVVDVSKERSAIKEAASIGVPIIALVDTNGNPALVDYVIPANDDAPVAIQVIFDYLIEAVQKGEVLAVEKATEKQLNQEISMMEESQEPIIFGLEDEEEDQGANKKGLKTSGIDQSKLSKKSVKKVSVSGEAVLEQESEKKAIKNNKK